MHGNLDNDDWRLFAGFMWTAAVVFVFMLVCGMAFAGEQRGVASTYGHDKGLGDRSDQRVACGGRLDVHAHTAAHQTLPCGTYVLVVNERNGWQTVVRVNDRGPFIKGRVIDLSPAAARSIGMGYGTAPVRIRWAAGRSTR